MVGEHARPLDGRSDRFAPPKVTGTVREALPSGGHEGPTVDARGSGFALAVLLISLVVAGCGASASAPSASPSAPPSATPRGAPLTQAEAVARVLAQDPRFAGIGPPDANLIGQSAWYEVSAAVVGWRVTVTIGWGDCQAGCISRHSWVYDVDAPGTVTLGRGAGRPARGWQRGRPGRRRWGPAGRDPRRRRALDRGPRPRRAGLPGRAEPARPRLRRPSGGGRRWSPSGTPTAGW